MGSQISKVLQLPKMKRWHCTCAELTFFGKLRLLRKPLHIIKYLPEKCHAPTRNNPLCYGCSRGVESVSYTILLLTHFNVTGAPNLLGEGV